MDEAHRLAGEGGVHGTAVAARVQAAGRGRRGRTWASPPGGLWMSIICRPPDPDAARCLSVRAGLAVARALEQVAAGIAPLALKWPNDLLRDDRKAGGILCEARWDGPAAAHVVVGVGVNVANEVPADLGSRAVALAELVPGVSPDALAEPVARAVAAAGRRRGRLSTAEVAAWAGRDWLAGRYLTAGAITGRGAGITPEGALLVRTAAGSLERVEAGEVSVVAGGSG